LENNSNKWYFEKIIDQSRSENDTNLLPVLKKIAANQDLDEEIRRHSAEITGILEKLPSSIQSPDEKIAYAKKTLSGIRSPQTTEILKLLRDNSVESKRLAIHLIGKFRLTDMLPEVCECLNIPGLETDASYVLRTFGDVAEDELIRFYLISSGNTNTSKTILRLLAETGTKENPGFLFSRLWSNSRQLKEVALNCLIACEFKPSEDDKERLHQLISDITGLITWNLSAKRCLEENNDTFLLGEMNKEISRWNKFLFNLLSVTYDPASITMIRENLEKETVESVNYALEMIDIVIDDSLKPKIVSLLDNVTEEEKLKNLYQFFPGEVPEYNKLLEDIINRDYNFLSLWTKACTLRDLPEFEGDDIAESVIALLFSPEVIIQEESARLIARSSRELYRTVSQRIPDSTKQRLDKIINGETNEKELLYEKIRFLSNCFSGIPEEELLSLAATMKYAENLHTILPLFSHGCLVWPLSDDKPGDEVYIHYNDQLKGDGDKFHGRNFTSFYILPFDSVEEFHYHFPDKSFEIFKYIDNKEE
jgi:AAA family ATP:ADP antiporter